MKPLEKTATTTHLSTNIGSGLEWAKNKHLRDQFLQCIVIIRVPSKRHIGRGEPSGGGGKKTGRKGLKAAEDNINR